MEMNEKQLRMIDEALKCHIIHLKHYKSVASGENAKSFLSSKIKEFENLKDDIEVLLLRF